MEEEFKPPSIFAVIHITNFDHLSLSILSATDKKWLGKKKVVMAEKTLILGSKQFWNVESRHEICQNLCENYAIPMVLYFFL